MFAVLILYCFWCFSWHFFWQCTKSHWPQFATSTSSQPSMLYVCLSCCALSYLPVQSGWQAPPHLWHLYIASCQPCLSSTLFFSSTISEKWRREETASSMLSCQLLLWWVPQSSLPIMWLHFEFMANSHLYVLFLYYSWQNNQGNM